MSVSPLRDLLAAHIPQFDRLERSPLNKSASTRLVVLFAMVGLILRALPAETQAFKENPIVPGARNQLLKTLLSKNLDRFTLDESSWRVAA